MMSGEYVVGVDVGTGSVRAALFTTAGKLVRMTTQPIQTWNTQPGYYHQSSDNIWQACCHVIKQVVAEVPSDSVKGLGFDATCSLVVLDKNDQPLTISPDGETCQNVILWMDHRAEKEAEAVNKTEHPILQYVGGKISLEMQVPKLMWLKKHLPETWESAGSFYDLPDFLTWKATGAKSRSLCSVVCKWTYEVTGEGINKGWNRDFFSQVELSDLMKNDCVKIGDTVLSPGTPCGDGLLLQVSQELGLRVGTPVATSIIDAHAGGLGLVGCTVADSPTDFCSRLAMICGTSTCHMAVSPRPVLVPGVWGPYYSAMVPGLWLSEGGQSATGRLIDHIIDTHPSTPALRAHLPAGRHVVEHLNQLLTRMAVTAELPFMDLLTKDLHVWPDYHGNRSPLADPTLRGMVCGLTLSADEKDLALLYFATVQALSYGTRHILERLEAAGLGRVDSVLLCGGLSKNPLFVQSQASVVRRPVLVPLCPESVLAGAAMLAAFAAGAHSSVQEAAMAMAGPAEIVIPDDRAGLYHDKKYQVFKMMVDNQKAYRAIMSSLDFGVE